jgi:threonine dehydrogenase-like Zn-dependent dehydrogenase
MALLAPDAATAAARAAGQAEPGGRMRAAVVAAPGRVEVTAAPVPAPGPQEVRVRVEGSGVCASSGPLWAGRPWFRYPAEPGAPGHEGWGRVDAVGVEVRGLAPGTPVAFVSARAFAEYDVAPAAGVVPLPSGLAGRPFPGEAFGCALNAFQRADVRPEHTVAVIGVGFLGAVLTRLAARAGARVLAVSRRPFALDLARRLGAAAAVPFGETAETAARVQAVAGGRECERVIEAVGTQAALDLATLATAPRGRLVIAGYHQDGPRRVDLQLWNWRGLDVVNAHERDPRAYARGIRAATRAVATGVLDPALFLTHRLPLERLGEAFDLLAARPAGFLKAWISPQRS